jgi:hypothetical protein
VSLTFLRSVYSDLFSWFLAQLVISRKGCKELETNLEVEEKKREEKAQRKGERKEDWKKDIQKGRNKEMCGTSFNGSNQPALC